MRDSTTSPEYQQYSNQFDKQFNQWEKKGLNDAKKHAIDAKKADSGHMWEGGLFTLWDSHGPSTEITGFESGGDDEGQWIWNPYKSIHYATSTLCMPAIVYNLKKEKQIKCMYRNCLMNHMTTGLSTTKCDMAFKERECLYVESAQFKKHGYMDDFFDNLWNLHIFR